MPGFVFLISCGFCVLWGKPLVFGKWSQIKPISPRKARNTRKGTEEKSHPSQFWDWFWFSPDCGFFRFQSVLNRGFRREGRAPARPIRVRSSWGSTLPGLANSVAVFETPNSQRFKNPFNHENHEIHERGLRKRALPPSFGIGFGFPPIVDFFGFNQY